MQAHSYHGMLYHKKLMFVDIHEIPCCLLLEMVEVQTPQPHASAPDVPWQSAGSGRRQPVGCSVQ